MKRRRLLWQLFPPMVVVTIVAVICTTFYASKLLREFYLDQIRTDLLIRTQLVADRLLEPMTEGDLVMLSRQSHELAGQVRARITIVWSNGEVAADSVEDPIRMDNHADRPEVAEALTGKPGVALRFSRTLGKMMFYVALPVESGRAIIPPGERRQGVVRLSIPLFSVEHVLGRLYLEYFLGAFILLVVAAAVTLYVSRKISRPLEEIQRIAMRYGEHDFKKKIILSSQESVSREVAGLAEAMNTMAFELNERIETVTKQKNELEAVFKSMVEGVIVVDLHEKVLRMNQTARELFRLPTKPLEGRPINEVIRNADLLAFVSEIVAGDKNVERDLTFDLKDERHFHASGSLLHDGSGKRIGVLVVLNDVTRTKKLENMRREFVANASHELKTPITSVKGFVETLLDGALDKKEDARRFLEIVHRQTNRLNAIVDDLLSLSRIEQEEEQGTIDLQEHQLRPMLENCLESCVIKAREKEIRLTLDCDPQIIVPMNQRLLEQAVTNLLVNAIKYSTEKGEVHISAYRIVNEICINVIDQGSGIAKEHLPRLFERFYRSDKARSRKLGGTGLGLAIVKHIVQAHGGDVQVKSELGKGSTFTIMLPGILS